MTVQEVMERAKTKDTKLVISLIEDAVHLIRSSYDEDTKDIFVQDFYISNFYNPSTQFVTFIVFSILIFICLFLIIFEVKHSKNKREKKLLIREYIVERKNIKKRMK